MRVSRQLVLFLLCVVPIVGASGQSPSDSARAAPVAPLTQMPLDAWGASVIVIDSAEIARSTAPTLSELLQARRPGVRVFRSGGTASDGALVMLRGPASVSGPSEPIIIVDGIRVDSRQFDNRLGGSPAPSRLDDLVPEDIQRIEILSGGAAALYGDGAANGVILVTTKSGGGPLRLSGRASWDASHTRADFPANYHRTGVSPSTGQPVADCSLIAVSNGQCTPTGLEVWNPLEQASPFRTGNAARGHVELSGDTLGFPFFMSATADERRGTLAHDEGSRLGFRGKIARALPGHIMLRAAGSYLRDNARLAVDGNSSLQPNVLGSGLTGTAVNDANHGYAAAGTPGDSTYPDQRLRHASGGVNLEWQPLNWLDAAARLTRDRVTAHWRQDELGTVNQVFQTLSLERHELRSATARVSASYHLSSIVKAATDIGLDRDVQLMATRDSSFRTGPGGILYSLTTANLRNRTTAFWIGERATLWQQLSATVALERITSTVFRNGAKEWFPSASVSWASAWRSRALSDLRLRAAYADAAGATESLLEAPFIVMPVVQGQPSTPKMERTKQLEAGADARIAGLVNVDLTAFSSHSSRLWIANSFGPNQGALALQGAEMSNVGMEALIASPLLESSRLRWSGSLSLALLRNRVTRLDTPPTFSLTDPLAQGQPFGVVSAQTYTYADANHDGIISMSEVQLDPTRSYLGPPLPNVESAFTTDVELPGGLAVDGTLDYRGGNRVLNLTEGLRCAVSVCRAAQDPSAPLDEQAAVVAERLSGQLLVARNAHDGSFLRLRELAAHWSIPARWSAVVGTRAQLTVAGRNLATWTKYQGLDPETSYRPPAILPRQDLLILPLPRELIVRLDIGSVK